MARNAGRSKLLWPGSWNDFCRIQDARLLESRLYGVWDTFPFHQLKCFSLLEDSYIEDVAVRSHPKRCWMLSGRITRFMNCELSFMRGFHYREFLLVGTKRVCENTFDLVDLKWLVLSRRSSKTLLKRFWAARLRRKDLELLCDEIESLIFFRVASASSLTIVFLAVEFTLVAGPSCMYTFIIICMHITYE